MREHGFPPDETGHFGIGFIVKNAVQRVVYGLLTAGLILLENGERQTGHGLRNDPDAGVNSGHLNSRSRVDRLAGTADAEGKSGGRADGVSGLIPCTEQKKKRVYHDDLP